MTWRDKFHSLFFTPGSYLILAALLCLPFADITFINSESGNVIRNILIGFVSPAIPAHENVLHSFINTIAFALQGVAVGIVFGFILSLYQSNMICRTFTSFIRSIHELFWALIFIQLFGLSSLTGVLAIAVPYTGIFAKVFNEQYENTSQAPLESIQTSRHLSLSVFLYARLPLAWPNMLDYMRYRIECGIRSSAVLGFIGLPTLGYHLESYFNQASYSEAAFLLYLLIALILSLRLWIKARIMALLLVASLVWLPPIAHINTSNIIQFFSNDIIPAPLRNGITSNSLPAIYEWLKHLSEQQIWPGLSNTILLSQIALAVTALIALLFFPLISRWFFSRPLRGLGHFVLVVFRSCPEYLLAFVFLLMLGPSMLPAILALGLHTGAIIAHLIGLSSNQLALREDHPKGVALYLFEIYPRIRNSFLSFLLYRWEVIVRESAILGILGIATLGFYIDSAFEEFRLDRAMLLILISALLNIGIDRLSYVFRQQLKPAA